MSRLRAWFRNRRIARARKRLIAAMALLDRELKTAGIGRHERHRLYRGIVSQAKTFTDLSELEQVLR